MLVTKRYIVHRWKKRRNLFWWPEEDSKSRDTNRGKLGIMILTSLEQFRQITPVESWMLQSECRLMTAVFNKGCIMRPIPPRE